MTEANEASTGLPREAWERLEPLLDRFEAAWKKGNKPDIADFLADAESERLHLLVELVQTDLRCRWDTGDPLRVETYLSRYPELARASTVVLDLILAEYQARKQRDQGPTLEEYLQRFPLYEAELRLWITGQRASDTVARLPNDPTRIAPPPADNSPTVLKPPQWNHAATPTRVTIPGYDILTFLGRGGMGIVFKARDVRLKRTVAIKMIPEGTFPSTDDLARFRREAEAVARLQHVNIVQIYEIGEHHNKPYISLEFVDGGNLVRRLVAGPQPPRQAAQLIETLARAMHYAHQRGIIHRDLKPANVLLTSDGIPKITDFGLAKRLDTDSEQTRSGAILGTPRYMAPEQAGGRFEIGTYTDVYSLGAILYELLTGQPPFEAPGMLETIELVRNKEPTPPTRLQPRLPRDLETICLQCLQKEPGRRYLTAEALAEDLRAYLNGEPIRARRAGLAERTIIWARRRPAEAILLAVGLVAVLGLVVGLWLHNFLAVGAVAVLGLLIGGGWYNHQLQSALDALAQQQFLAERHVERLHLMLEMTHRLMSAPNFATLLQVISETTTQLLHCERATIYLVDEDKRELWSKVALGDDVGEIRIPLGIGIAGTVAVTGTQISLPDAYADPRFNPDVDRRTGYRTRNLLTVPIKARDGRVLGVYQVLNKKGGPFTPEDMQTLAALGSSAAVAIEFAVRRGQGGPAKHTGLTTNQMEPSDIAGT